MANHKSSEKRARQDEKKRALNKAKHSKVKTAIKALHLAIASKEKDKVTGLLRTVQAASMKLAKSGFITRKNASRLTSRLAKSVAKI